MRHTVWIMMASARKRTGEDDGLLNEYERSCGVIY